MTSQRKIAANRSNSLKSSGPRTAAGKRRASRNGHKHGLAALSCRQPAGSAEVDQLARAICGDEQDPGLIVQARIIAENHLIRQTRQRQKLAAIERAVAQARLSESEFERQTIDALVVNIFEKFQDWLPPLDVLKQRLCSEDILAFVDDDLDQEEHSKFRRFVRKFLKQVDPIRPPREIDEYQALELAGADLDKLERYETRAHSRQMRAIREFIEIKRSAES
jgi:hypothetical protein